MGSLDQYLDWPLKFEDINSQKNSSLMAFSRCENISCFVALSIVFYMLIRILYYNKGDATYSMLSESEIYIPNLKCCLFKEHRQFEEHESLGLCIIVLLQEKKEAEKKMAATALYVHSYHLDEAMVSGSFPKLGNCSHEEILMFPRCQGVNNIIFVYKAQPINAKVSLCFSV